MTRLFNRFGEKRMRQELRSDMPTCEVILWSRLKGRQLDGLKFRRQYSVGPYSVDFHCTELKLAIEVDGDSHFGDGAEERDAKRQSHIEKAGIRVIRFTNTEVAGALDQVVEEIERVAESLRRPDLPSPPLVKWGLSPSDPPQPPLGKGGL